VRKKIRNLFKKKNFSNSKKRKPKTLDIKKPPPRGWPKKFWMRFRGNYAATSSASFSFLNI
jgi:hypothetical protein